MRTTPPLSPSAGEIPIAYPDHQYPISNTPSYVSICDRTLSLTNPACCKRSVVGLQVAIQDTNLARMGVGQVERILGESNTASRVTLHEESILVSWSKQSAFNPITSTIPNPLCCPLHCHLQRKERTGNLPDQVRRHIARVMVVSVRHFGSVCLDSSIQNP